MVLLSSGGLTFRQSLNNASTKLPFIGKNIPHSIISDIDNLHNPLGGDLWPPFSNLLGIGNGSDRKRVRRLLFLEIGDIFNTGLVL